MLSRWFEYKDKAIQLRKNGVSVRSVEKKLGIPRSTLSGWFKDFPLSKKFKKKLFQNRLEALVRGREKAAIWHRSQKEKRLKTARQEALGVLNSIELKSKGTLELALAMLYLGEGRKTQHFLSLASSDPLILRFYVVCLKKLYNIDVDEFRCTLFLRADQDGRKLKNYWSKKIGLASKTFVRIYNDRRTLGSKTYADYKGVCDVSMNNVATQRRLVFLSRLFCERISGA